MRCEINSGKALSAEYEFTVRFNEVDSMGIMWHGNYVEYLELSREAFGHKYGLSYLDDIYKQGYYVPVVKLEIDYKKMLAYGVKACVSVRYIPTLSAKICFEYEIAIKSGNGAKEIIATARTTQVFTDLQKNLVLDNPTFYEEWKEKWLS